MRFPKLSRSGRNFLREVVIVVLGVFIALDRLLKAIAEQMLANIAQLGVRGNRTLSGLDLRSRPLCQPLAAAGA
jgi:hypothetical protein